MDTAVSAAPEVSIVVPARNEEVCLGDCLTSLVSQTGVAFEIIVVDDDSTDRTRAIAESFKGVRVISPGPLPDGWTGKNNAVVASAKEARGEWLLFTDADTVHLAGSLSWALAEAKENRMEMLSYSPEQLVVTFWERAVMPVVFAELARQYTLEKISDSVSPIAAANGQYILIRRETYDAVGGHAAIAMSLLEDVALARAVKSSGRKISLRYGENLVRTRMYRSFRQLQEGWTKNLALLFPRPGTLAAKQLLEWGITWGLFLWPLFLLIGTRLTNAPMFLALGRTMNHWWWIAIVVFAMTRLHGRLRDANFGWGRDLLGAIFGYPMFAYLLLCSKKAHQRGGVSWKGRTYSGGQPAPAVSREITRPSGPAIKATLESRP
jgi:glycosyltransferase involved in cell wall biosynthesis